MVCSIWNLLVTFHLHINGIYGESSAELTIDSTAMSIGSSEGTTVMLDSQTERVHILGRNDIWILI